METPAPGAPESTTMDRGYYAPHRATLERLFGPRDLAIPPDRLRVGDTRYAIAGDIIEITPVAPAEPRANAAAGAPLAGDIRDTFGAEWQAYPEILPEHEREF